MLLSEGGLHTVHSGASQLETVAQSRGVGKLRDAVDPGPLIQNGLRGCTCGYFGWRERKARSPPLIQIRGGAAEIFENWGTPSGGRVSVRDWSSSFLCGQLELTGKPSSIKDMNYRSALT